VYKVVKRMSKEVEGLYPAYMKVDTGVFDGVTYGIGADTDSFYEYLLKIWISTGEEKFRKMYDESADAILKYLLVKSPGDKHYYIPDRTGVGSKPSPQFHHLSCFSGGMFTLGAMTRKTNDWTVKLDVGRRITETCYALYRDSATGLGASEFAYVQNDGRVVGATNVVTLRPEVIESIFYQYRTTKDPKFREWGRNIVGSIEKHAKSADGIYHSLQDGKPKDKLESFFMAETLKYLYLLFSDSKVIDLEEYVFNTEAHPISRRGFGQRKDPSKWVKITT
jgi:mannosyl-oligosaccharide alpha-1,2-mannosidase